MRRGATVTLIDHKSEREAEPWLTCVTDEGPAAYRQADVRDRSALENALRSVEPLDIAIGNAGIVNAGLARHQLETEPQYARRLAKAIPLGALQTAEQVARAMASCARRTLTTSLDRSS